MNVETGASHVGHEDCQGEAKYAEMQKVCGAKDSEISELKTQIILKTAEIGQLVDKCEASDTKLAEVSKAHTQTAANVTEMQSKLSDKLVEVDTLTAKIAELKALPAKTSEQPKSGVCSIM
jgi:chromosome segregation ATPase